MKTIYIVRHAKAILQSPELDDLERPLLYKGEENTKFITDYLLKHENIKIYMLITSHAKRAFKTAILFAEAFNFPFDNIKSDTQLYYSGSTAIFNQFYDIPDHIGSVMIVGHNPSISSFVNYFIEDKIDNFPTSGIVGINFNINKWFNLNKAKGKEIFRVFPKIVKDSRKFGSFNSSFNMQKHKTLVFQ